MAVSTSSYFNNAIIGTPQVGADIDIYETGSNPKYAVGFGFERSDGNKYRYCHFGAITDVGEIAATDNIESSTTATGMSLQKLSPTLYTPAGVNVAPNAIGSYYIQMNHTGGNLSVAKVTKDVFAGGYIGFVGGSGTDLTYRIKGNTDAGIPAAGECYLELYSPLVTPVDTTTSFLIQGCKYANLEPALSTAPRYANASGFAVVGNSAANYGWICTKGVTGAVTGTPIASEGCYAIVSTNTAGAISVAQTGVLGSQAPYAAVCVIMKQYSASSFALVNACLE